MPLFQVDQSKMKAVKISDVAQMLGGGVSKVSKSVMKRQGKGQGRNLTINL